MGGGGGEGRRARTLELLGETVHGDHAQGRGSTLGDAVLCGGRVASFWVREGVREGAGEGEYEGRAGRTGDEERRAGLEGLNCRNGVARKSRGGTGQT